MSTTLIPPTLARYAPLLMERYDNFPHGKYVNLIVIRKTEGEAIFRTEGSGEGLVKETVVAGLTREHQQRLRRVVISKRKQTAVERRTGREVLREHDLLFKSGKEGKEQVCALNTNAPCGKCIDCMLYGYAVGGGGAQKSRVMTDDAYSIAAAAQVTGRHTFNATYDNGTMRNPFTGDPSTAINEDEYVLPETHFLDIETLKDVTAGELTYVLGNIVRSSRYGAISSRIGKIRNSVAAVIFSDTEIFANLELTQAVFDRLAAADGTLEVPLFDYAVADAVTTATDQLLGRLVSRAPVVVRGADLQPILDETAAIFREPGQVRSWLEAVTHAYPAR